MFPYLSFLFFHMEVKEVITPSVGERISQKKGLQAANLMVLGWTCHCPLPFLHLWSNHQVALSQFSLLEGKANTCDILITHQLWPEGGQQHYSQANCSEAPFHRAVDLKMQSPPHSETRSEITTTDRKMTWTYPSAQPDLSLAYIQCCGQL